MMIKDKSAFTLIEIVMVIIILAIMAVMVIPRSVDVAVLRMDMAAKKMQADIRYAQSLAISSQRWTRIVFNATNDDYTLSIDNSGATPSGWTQVTDPLTKGAYSIQLNSGNFADIDITLVFFNSSDRDLVFDRWGNPYSYTGAGAPIALNNPARVRLDSGSETKDIRVERGTGRVYIE